MQEFDYTIEHIAGVKNVVADALSRRSDYKPAPPQAGVVPGDPTLCSIDRDTPMTRFHDDPDQALPTHRAASVTDDRERAVAAAERVADRATYDQYCRLHSYARQCTAVSKRGHISSQETRRDNFFVFETPHVRCQRGNRRGGSRAQGAEQMLRLRRTGPLRTRRDVSTEPRCSGWSAEAPPPRPIGRPKKKRPLLLEDSSACTPAPPAEEDLRAGVKRRYENWFSSPFIHDIIRAFKRSGGIARKAVLPRFREQLEEHEAHARGKGPLPAFAKHPEMERRIKQALLSMRDAGSPVNQRTVAWVMQAIIEEDAPELLQTLRLSQSFLTRWM